jgi:hypothetical protein
VHHNKIPNSAYMPGLSIVSFHHSIGHRRWRTNFLSWGEQGWKRTMKQSYSFGGKVNIVELLLTVRTQVLLSFDGSGIKLPILKPWRHSTIATKRSSCSLVNAIS